MTTSNENSPRGIGVLLSLNTYQGMTDEEIESIIAHKCNMAYDKGNMDAIASQSMINVMDNKRRMNELFSRVDNMINYKGTEVSE